MIKALARTTPIPLNNCILTCILPLLPKLYVRTNKKTNATFSFPDTPACFLTQEHLPVSVPSRNSMVRCSLTVLILSSRCFCFHTSSYNVIIITAVTPVSSVFTPVFAVLPVNRYLPSCDTPVSYPLISPFFNSVGCQC